MNDLAETQNGDLKDLAALLDNSESSDGLKLDFKRLLLGVWERRLSIVLASILGLLTSTILIVSLISPSWEGRVTLLQKEQKDEFRVGRHGLPYKTQQYSFKTLLDTLKLPGTLDTAARRSGLIMPTTTFAQLVDVHLGKESKAFTVSVRFDDPVKAKELANNLADVFVQRNRELRRREIEKQLIHYRERLEASDNKALEATNSLREFEGTNEISDINTQLTVLLEKRQALELDVRALEGNLLAKQQEDINLSQSIESVPDMIVQASYYENPLGKHLEGLEWSLTQARGRYTDDNPKVKDLIQRIEKLRGQIVEQKNERSPSQTYAHNPVKQAISISQYTVKGEALRLETELKSLKPMLDELTQRINRLTRTRKQHEILTNQKESALVLMTDLRERVDSLNVLRQADLGDFELLEPARVPEMPSSDGRKMLILVLTVLIAGGSVVAALVLEFLNPRIRSLKDLEFTHEFEVVGEFEKLHFPDVSLDEPVSRQAIQYRRFANDLQIALEAMNTKRIAFASPESSSGATTATKNTVFSMYMKGESVTLVDADLREHATPVGSDHPNVAINSPLLDMLEGRKQLLPLRELNIIPSRDDFPIDASTSLKIGGFSMSKLRKQLEKLAGYTFYDLPPVSENEAAFEALKQIGSVVLVSRSGQTSKQELSELITRCEHHGIRIVAGVLLDVPEEFTSKGAFRPVDNIRRDLEMLIELARDGVKAARVRLGWISTT